MVTSSSSLYFWTIASGFVLMADAQQSLWPQEPRLHLCRTTGVYQEVLQTLDEIITFLSHMPYFEVSISTCDASNDLRISLKTNWRKRVRVERTDDIRDAVRRF
jgi:hypothetical protein